MREKGGAAQKKAGTNRSGVASHLGAFGGSFWDNTPVWVVMAAIFPALNVPGPFPLPVVWKSVTAPALLEGHLHGHASVGVQRVSATCV